VFASGGRLFNETLDPIFPNEDKTAPACRVDAGCDAHVQILDPKGLELDETQARDVFRADKAYSRRRRQRLPRANNPQHSKRAGDIAMMRFPGFKDDVTKGPMGWTRLYCISAAPKVRDAAWRLIYYMGARTRRAIIHAKDWYLKYGVGYAFNRSTRCRLSSRRNARPDTTATCSSSRSELPARAKTSARRGTTSGSFHPAADPEHVAAPDQGRRTRLWPRPTRHAS